MTRSRDIRVCFLGDSFVAGIGDPAALGWVGRVIAEASARGIPITGYNLGVRRETSVQIAARCGVEVRPRLEGAEDPRVVASFGVNDTVDENGRPRVDAVESVRAFERLCESVAPTRHLFVGPPATADHAQNERIRELDAALRASAGRLSVPFLSTFETTRSSETWQREIAAGDGFHPGAAGYEVLTRVVIDPILSWIGIPRRGDYDVS